MLGLDMDPFEAEIVRVLRDGKPRRFSQILGEVVFSRNTLRLHLEHLLEKGLVMREKTPSKKPGRPVYMYSMPVKSRLQAPQLLSNPYDTLVTLSFSKLKQMCRHEKGGYCKKSRAQCTAEKCPQTLG